jgi:GNAT superfamily N-acetyltransferase
MSGSLLIRRAVEADLADIAAMVEDFARGHLSEKHPRPLGRLRAAYFGPEPCARVFVAVRRGAVVGMGQWIRCYDMFWAMFGGMVEWLYVRPEARGLGIAAALVAAICDDVRKNGGEFLHGGGDGDVARLYERVAQGWPTRSIYLSAEAFQVFADLAGERPREIVRRLPAPDLNRVPARPRP